MNARSRIRQAEVEVGKARRIRVELRRLAAAEAPDALLVARALEDLDGVARRALERAPDHPAALVERGLSLSLRGRHADAEAIFTRVLELDPAHADARAHRASARFFRAAPPLPTLVLEGRRARMERVPAGPGLDLAAADVDLLPRDHPDRPLVEALIAVGRGDPGGEAAALRRALDRAPYLLDVREALSRAELLLGNPEGAVREASRALALGHRVPTVWAARAYGRALLGDPALAADDAREALARCPDWVELRGFLAFWLASLGRFAESAREYDIVMDARPGRVDDLLGRSLARLGAGDAAGARADAREACRQAPGSAAAQVRRGLAADEDREALEAFARAIELDPSLAEAYAWRGNRQLRAGHPGAAAKDYAEAIRLEPGFPAWGLLLALSCLAAGDVDAAERAFSDVVARHPQEAEGYAGRGRARFLQERFADALGDLERAASLDPPGAAPLAELIAECRRRGEK